MASSISPCCSPHQHSPRTRDRCEQLTQGLSAGLLSPTTLDLNSSASVMEVSHGGEAGMVWDHMVRGNSNPEERKRLKAALLAYCRQDTQAMARVLESLKSLTATRAGSH